jgi:N6-L-threonylcarbamoyladenine synthase
VARTRDDAAGEALDKLSKFLGLGYPGGPVIDRLSRNGNPNAYPFSIPKISDGSLDFSFSGFKTAAIRHIQASRIKPRRAGQKPSQVIIDLVASYQKAIVDTLVAQTRKASEGLHPGSILLVGGVACNSLLRSRFKEVFDKTSCVYCPDPAFTTDNAAMIAAAGTPKLRANPSLPLELNAYADLRLW